MSLQAILDNIYASGEAQIAEIEKASQARVGEVLAHARMEARQIEDDASAAASAPAAQERARILHRARLEALRLVGSVREELVDTALCQTREHLANIRTNIAYVEVLPRLAEEALTALDAPTRNEKAVLVVAEQDQDIIKKVLGELDENLQLSNDLQCWGGLIVRSEDGRVVVINTLEARLERATPFLRGYLASFFEAEEPEIEFFERT